MPPVTTYRDTGRDPENQNRSLLSSWAEPEDVQDGDWGRSSPGSFRERPPRPRVVSKGVPRFGDRKGGLRLTYKTPYRGHPSSTVRPADECRLPTIILLYPNV